LSRPELIKNLKEKNSKLNQSELETVIDVFTESITSALKEKKAVEIRDFGRWYCKKLKENFNARNPSNNQLIYKPERIKIRFKRSKHLKKLINE
jgi:nucleoid DNA-binding protein